MTRRWRTTSSSRSSRQRASLSRIVDDPASATTSSTRATGRRRASGVAVTLSQFLGYTDNSGHRVRRGGAFPYESDLDWDDLTEPADIQPVLVQLGKATAKLHCVGDATATLAGALPDGEAITEMIGDRREGSSRT